MSTSDNDGGTRTPRSNWRSAALFATLLLLVVVQLFGEVPGHGRISSGVQNGLHGLWFAAVTLVVHALLVRRCKGTQLFVLIAVLLPALAIGTELVQSLTGGDAEALDVFFDLMGGAGALALRYAGRLRRRGALARRLGALLLLGTLEPALVAFAIQLHRNAIFPELVDLGAYRVGGLLASAGTSAWRIVPPPVGWENGRRAVLEVTLADESWPGIYYLDEPQPDWRGYESLVVETFVPDSVPMVLHVSVRLRGAPTDHEYRSFVLVPGANRVLLPIRELFDPAAAAPTAVVAYSERRFAGRRLYVGRVALERAPEAAARLAVEDPASD